MFRKKYRIHLYKNERGFLVGAFCDVYSIACSIQESSSAENDHIWLGCDSNRMHLDRVMAKELIRHLKKFVRTGHL